MGFCWYGFLGWCSHGLCFLVIVLSFERFSLLGGDLFGFGECFDSAFVWFFLVILLMDFDGFCIFSAFRPW